MKLEMRTLKNIAAAAMTLAVVFGAASLKPVTANAAEASGSASIEEENSYISFQDEAYQNEFLCRVNNERAKAGLKPVQLGDSNHNSAAQERAKELASSYSYVRPNGQRDFTIFAENGINDASVGENYIAGVSTPDAAVDQWMNIDFARERMLNADVTTMSVGHYEGGVYNNYWVLIFSCPENSYTSNYRQEVLNLVNAERAKYGLQPLVMGDAKLTAAAQQRAEEIATVNSHVRPNGTKWYTVLSEYGVTDAAAGENAAWGSVSPEEVVNAWMNSEAIAQTFWIPKLVQWVLATTTTAPALGAISGSSSLQSDHLLSSNKRSAELQGLADFLLRFFLAEDMRAAVPGAGLDTKTYAAVVAQRTIYVILILNNMQEEPQWRITAPSMARPQENTKKRRAASLRRCHLRTARKLPLHFWNRCVRPTAPPATMCMLTACGKATGNAIQMMVNRPRRRAHQRWRCCSTAA